SGRRCGCERGRENCCGDTLLPGTDFHQAILAAIWMPAAYRAVPTMARMPRGGTSAALTFDRHANNAHDRVNEAHCAPVALMQPCFVVRIDHLVERDPLQFVPAPHQVEAAEDIHPRRLGDFPDPPDHLFGISDSVGSQDC